MSDMSTQVLIFARLEATLAQGLICFEAESLHPHKALASPQASLQRPEGLSEVFANRVHTLFCSLSASCCGLQAFTTIPEAPTRTTRHVLQMLMKLSHVRQISDSRVGAIASSTKHSCGFPDDQCKRGMNLPWFS